MGSFRLSLSEYAGRSDEALLIKVIRSPTIQKRVVYRVRALFHLRDCMNIDRRVCICIPEHPLPSQDFRPKWLRVSFSENLRSKKHIFIEQLYSSLSRDVRCHHHRWIPSLRDGIFRFGRSDICCSEFLSACLWTVQTYTATVIWLLILDPLESSRIQNASPRIAAKHCT